MKKILFVASFATLLAAGCQKTEILNPMDTRQGLTFTTEFGKLTKAADADDEGLENLQAQDFRIWAYAAHDFDNTPENDLNQIFDEIKNIKVHDYTPTGSTEPSWKPEKQYFWPGNGKNLYFFAVSDTAVFMGAEGSDSPVDIKLALAAGDDPATTKIPMLTVKNYVVDPANPNNDLMVANFIKQNQDQSDKKVSLKFNHTLAKIQFEFKTNEVPATSDPITVFVQKLEVGQLADDGTTVIGGLQNKGELEATIKQTTAATAQTAEVSTLDFKWTRQDDLAIFKDDCDDVPADFPTKIDDVPVDASTDKTALKLTTTPQEFATWLVLPQDVKGKKVKVTYLINGRQFANEFNLDAFTDRDNNDATCMWDVNQYVKYTINLSPNLITFDADVTPWTESTTNNVTHQN